MALLFSWIVAKSVIRKYFLTCLALCYISGAVWAGAPLVGWGKYAPESKLTKINNKLIRY